MGILRAMDYVINFSEEFSRPVGLRDDTAEGPICQLRFYVRGEIPAGKDAFHSGIEFFHHLKRLPSVHFSQSQIKNYHDDSSLNRRCTSSASAPSLAVRTVNPSPFRKLCINCNCRGSSSTKSSVSVCLTRAPISFASSLLSSFFNCWSCASARWRSLIWSGSRDRFRAI
jgi:hypothetical protein